MGTATQRRLARPYRDFLTPTLHRRFTNAAILTLGLCFVVSLWMSQWTSIVWTLFPLGSSGIRALLLFLSILAIYVLRVANLHIGTRLTPSPLNTLISYTVTMQTAQALMWYTFSAWFYCEVYLWSASAESRLSMVDPGRPNERPRLNERPIYLRSMFLILAIVQTIHHLNSDYDQVKYPPTRLQPSNLLEDFKQPHPAPLGLMRERLVSMLNRAAIQSLGTTIAGTLVYTIFLRQPAWHWTFTVAKNVFTLPKNSRPARYPQMIGDLLGRFCIEALLLGILWEFANAAFSIFVAQEPLKNDTPLTNDSKDSNGSLLTGLRSKKEVPRSTAFWELRLIATRFKTRREMLYLDIDHIGGAAWSQILTVCLGELHALVKRVQDFQNPPSSIGQTNGQAAPPSTLPKIAPSLKDDNVLKKAPSSNGFAEAMASNLSTFAKSHGLSPERENPLAPRAKKFLTYGTDHLLSKEQQAEIAPSHLTGVAQDYVIRYLKTPAGQPFRATFRRRALAVILGAPFGNLSILSNATTSLSKLAVHSLKEDPYGKVQGDVANIIRTYTSTIETIESFLGALPVHWTDVLFVSSDKKVPEIEAILLALREGLNELVGEFGEFQDDLGLKRVEMRKAKEAAARKDIQEVR